MSACYLLNIAKKGLNNRSLKLMMIWYENKNKKEVDKKGLKNRSLKLRLI